MRPLTVQLHTPFAGTQRGNAVTAERWAAIFAELGHRVVDDDGDVLVALHARHGHDAIVAFRRAHPGRPIVLALTGTDIYRDVQRDEAAQHSLELADRYVVLQPHAVGELPQHQRGRARVIYQSAVAPSDAPPPPMNAFRACVVGHLRAVKDPLRTAEALRLLPADSRVEVVHLGAALDPTTRRRAELESETNPRYVWLGERSRDESLRVIASSHLLVLTSELEGGANVLTEAIACRVPTVSTRMGAAIGILGADYPGLFEVGDTAALARLLTRASTDDDFLALLTQRCAAKLPLVDPALERECWAALLNEFDPDADTHRR